jgi:hypothetical protein
MNVVASFRTSGLEGCVCVSVSLVSGREYDLALQEDPERLRRLAC